MKILFTFQTPFNQKAAHNKSLKSIIKLEFTILMFGIFLKLQSPTKMTRQMAAYCDVYQGIFHFSLLKYMCTSEYRIHPSSPKNCIHMHACTHTEGKIIVFCFLSFYSAAVALKQCRNLNLVPQVPNVLKEETAE